LKTSFQIYIFLFIYFYLFLFFFNFLIFQKILHFPLQFFCEILFLKHRHFKEYVICAKATKALGKHFCFVTLKEKLLKQTQLDEKSSKCKMRNKPIFFCYSHQSGNDPQEHFSQIWLQGKYENN